VPCLREPRKLDKVAAVAGRVPQRRAGSVRIARRVGASGIMLTFPPGGPPQLNAPGEARRRAKRALLNS